MFEESNAEKSDSTTDNDVREQRSNATLQADVVQAEFSNRCLTVAHA